MWLLLISIVFASLNGVLLHKVKFNNSRAIYQFNGICSLVWLIVLMSLNGFKLDWNQSVVMFGVIYGVTQALFVFFKTAAMNSGPVSITTLVGNASLLISVFACYFLWDEPVNVYDISGISILLISIFFSTYQRSKVKISKRWYVFSVLFLVCGAGVGISFKAFSKSAAGQSINDMMIVAAAVMLTLYVMLSSVLAISSKVKKKHSLELCDKRVLFLYAIGAGILSCVYNRLNIRLSGELDAVIFFPTFNGGVVILSALLAALIFKEKLSKKQIFSLIFGVIGICIIGIF